MAVSTQYFPSFPVIELHFHDSDTEETIHRNTEMISKLINEFQDQLNVHKESEAALIAKIT